MATSKAVKAAADELPTVRPDFMGDSARGNEQVSADDMVIPRLSIIQDLSPQYKRGKPEYIEGAEQKMIFNTATGTLFGTQAFVVPVSFRKEWVVWKNLDSGGGYKGAFPNGAEAAAFVAQQPDKDNLEIIDTHDHFVLVIPFDTPTEELHLHAKMAVISMSVSQMKVSRKWNTIIGDFGGDRFSRIYRIETVDDENTAGKEYYNWKITPLAYVTEPLYRMAEKMYERIAAGEMEVKRERDTPARASTSASPEAGASAEDDDVQF